MLPTGKHAADFAAGFAANFGHAAGHGAEAHALYLTVSSRHGSWWIDGFCARADMRMGATETPGARVARAIGLETT